VWRNGHLVPGGADAAWEEHGNQELRDAAKNGKTSEPNNKFGGDGLRDRIDTEQSDTKSGDHEISGKARDGERVHVHLPV